MKLKNVTVTQGAHLYIEGAEGETKNGRVLVYAAAMEKLVVGEHYVIAAAGGFSVKGPFMGMDPAGALQFKID